MAAAGAEASLSQKLAKEARMTTVLTSAGGSWSAPNGVSSLTKVEVAVQRPRNSSGNIKSAGPPPIASQARSSAGGSLLAAACRSYKRQTNAHNKHMRFVSLDPASPPQSVLTKQLCIAVTTRCVQTCSIRIAPAVGCTGLPPRTACPPQAAMLPCGLCCR